MNALLSTGVSEFTPIGLLTIIILLALLGLGYIFIMNKVIKSFMKWLKEKM